MQPYDSNDQRAIARFILDNLPRHKQMAIATVNNGSPWVVCVSHDVNAQLEIIWVSAADTEHSKNITAHPEVSICIFSQIETIGDFGLYIRGTAQEVTDPSAIQSILAFRSQKRQKPTPDVAEFQAPALMRVYRTTIQQAWVTDQRHQKTVVDLNILRQLAATHPSYQQAAQASPLS